MKAFAEIQVAMPPCQTLKNPIARSQAYTFVKNHQIGEMRDGFFITF